MIHRSVGVAFLGAVVAVVAARSPWCWGSNTYGNVGNGTQGNTVPNPTEVLVNW